jgi:hypothetical protein
MTLAAGFRCIDGIVLARAGGGAVPKWERHIFEQTTPGYTIAVTGAGNVDLVRMAAEHWARELDEDAELDEIARCAEKVIRRLCKKHILCYGANDPERPQLQLLLGASTAHGHLLLRSDANRVARVDGCEFAGSGELVGRSLASWLYEPTLPVAVVARLASQIICNVQQHAAAGGRAAHVLVLRHGVPQTRLASADAEQDFFWGVNQVLQPILIGCLDERVSDVEFDDRLRWFEEKMSAVRQALKDAQSLELPNGNDGEARSSR